MAGGSGTRFWPLSRGKFPKQLISLGGERSLIQQTVHRLSGLIPKERILVVTAASQAQGIKEQLPQIPHQNILVEPIGRNTAPCIALAALYLKKIDPEAVMAVMPADHLILNNDGFKQAIDLAAALAMTDDCLVTLGIEPHSPHTGYGYILLGDELGQPSGLKAYKVKDFTEKPDLSRAKEYLADGALWNSGIFVWRTEVILAATKQYLPNIYEPLLSIEQDLDTSRQDEVLSSVYPALESISIDYGIMEKYPRTVVVKADLGWNDIGSWTSLREVFPKDTEGNVTIGQHFGLESSDLIIHSPHKPVATIGVKNLIIVETEDVLLVCDADCDQDVKQLVEMLKAEGKEEYL